MDNNDHKSLLDKIAGLHLDAVKSFIPIADKGTCNIVYCAETLAGKVIIRFNQDRAVDEFNKEHWCMKQAAAKGANVAKPIAEGFIDGFHYSVQNYVGSLHGEDMPEQLSIWRFLGEQASKFHHIRVSGFGEKLVDSNSGRFEQNWAEYLQENCDAFRIDSVDGLPRDKQIVIAEKFDELLQLKLVFGLCHGDLCPRNVVANDNGEMTIIDWGCAHAHVTPHYDFVELLREHDRNSAEVKSFMDGYGVANGDRQALLD